MTFIDLLSPEAAARLPAALGSDPNTSEQFADLARRIAGNPSEVGMTRDHILAVTMLVASKTGMDPQTATVLALAIEELRAEAARR